MTAMPEVRRVMSDAVREIVALAEAKGVRIALPDPAVPDPVEATLLGFQAPIGGRIESITGGISAANAASSTQGLPNVDPIFTWVRLAQRIPVRIKIEQVPPGVPLVAGMTCSVSVIGRKGGPVSSRAGGRIFDRLGSLLRGIG